MAGKDKVSNEGFESLQAKHYTSGFLSALRSRTFGTQRSYGPV
jgi:hypothetical protein